MFWRKFGYVDFASEEDLQKAMELNGKKLMGQPVKLDKARTKEDSQENKKGKIADLSVNPTRNTNFSFSWTHVGLR